MMKSSIILEPSVILAPMNSLITTSLGRLAAATASASAKLVTMPVCRRVARVAEALNPKRQSEQQRHQTYAEGDGAQDIECLAALRAGGFTQDPVTPNGAKETNRYMVNPIRLLV